MKTITAGKKVLWRVKEARTFYEKMRGIMFKTRFEPLLFEFAQTGTIQNSIHSLFCPEFHAVFLDENKTVTETILVAPFSFIIPSKPAKYLIETPAKSVRVKPGTRLSW